VVSALALGLLLAVGCCAQRTAGASSGFRGIVLRGPMCPGPVRPDRPCPDQPVEGSFDVVGDSGAVVATFRSDAQGGFRVEVPPGAYTVWPQEHRPGRNPLGESARVIVPPGEMVEIKLNWDTGMR